MMYRKQNTRVWRTLTLSGQQLVRDCVRLQNQVKALLEEMRIKLSGVTAIGSV